MDREFFLTTDRIGFSMWQPDDMDLAETLWGNPDVTKFICASGIFSKEDIANRLAQEVARQEEHSMRKACLPDITLTISPRKKYWLN